jgi:hypothetical protein
MTSRTRTAVFLSAALGLALTFSPAQAALPDDSVQKATPDSAQATDDPSTVAAAKPTAGILRTTRTGSHIARVRSDGSLPVSEYDRTYIDRTGAATTADMLRTIPQVQVGR